MTNISRSGTFAKRAINLNQLQASDDLTIQFSSLLMVENALSNRAVEVLKMNIDYDFICRVCVDDEERDVLRDLLVNRDLYHGIREKVYQGTGRADFGEPKFLMPSLYDLICEEMDRSVPNAKAVSKEVRFAFTSILAHQWSAFNNQGNSEPFHYSEKREGPEATKRLILRALVKREVLASIENFTIKYDPDTKGKKFTMGMYSETILSNFGQLAAALGRIGEISYAFDDMLTLIAIFHQPALHDSVPKEYQRVLRSDTLREVASNATLFNLAMDINASSNTLWSNPWDIESTLAKLWVEIKASTELRLVSLATYRDMFTKTTLRAVDGAPIGAVVSKNVRMKGDIQVTEFLLQSQRMAAFSQVEFPNIEAMMKSVPAAIVSKVDGNVLHAMMAGAMPEIMAAEHKDGDEPVLYQLFTSEEELRYLAASVAPTTFATRDDGSTVIRYMVDLRGKNYRPAGASGITTTYYTEDPAEALMLLEDFQGETAFTVNEQLIPTASRGKSLICNPRSISQQLDATFSMIITGEITANLGCNFLRLNNIQNYKRLRMTTPEFDRSIMDTFFDVAWYLTNRVKGTAIEKSIKYAISTRLHTTLAPLIIDNAMVKKMASTASAMMVSMSTDPAEKLRVATHFRTKRYELQILMQCALLCLSRLGFMRLDVEEREDGMDDARFVLNLLEESLFYEAMGISI